jgi:tetratricopeptide (TPR) repeat protein
MKSRPVRPATPPPSTKGGVAATRRWAIAGVVLLAAVAGIVAVTANRHEPMASPPEIDLSSASPAIAAAINDARQRVVESPDSGEAWGRLGMILLAHQYEAPTAVCLRQAETLEPHEFRWPYLLGVHRSVSDPAAAAEHFQRAAELRPDEAIVHARMGELLMHLNQVDKAGIHLRRAAELDSANPRPPIALARMALAAGDAESALPWAEFAARIAPQERASYEALALVYERLGRRQEALRALAHAEEFPARPLGWSDPFAAQVLRLRKDPAESLDVAQTLLSQQRIPEAISVLETALDRDRSDPAVYVSLARAYLSANQPQRAEAVLAEAQEKHPRAAQVWFQLGVLRFVTGEFEQAAASFQGAIERKHDYADAHYNLGHARLRLGDESGALEAFGDAIRLRPDYAHAHTNLAKLLWKAGRGEEALEHLRISLELDPSDPEAKKLQTQLSRE